MSDPEKSAEKLLDLFGDEHVHQILLLTSETPMSAAALADELDVSRPTVYRRVNDLVRYGILQEDVEMDLDGHHHKTFELALNEITFRIDDGQLGLYVVNEAGLTDGIRPAS